jgi:hypothetical protein
VKNFNKVQRKKSGKLVSFFTGHHTLPTIVKKDADRHPFLLPIEGLRHSLTNG